MITFMTGNGTADEPASPVQVMTRTSAAAKGREHLPDVEWQVEQATSLLRVSIHHL